MTLTKLHPSDAAAFFEESGLPAPPLAADLLRAMRARSTRCFVSEGFQGDSGDGAPLSDAARRWLANGSSQLGARCEVVGHGLRSTFIQVAFESPRCGIFLSKLVSEAFDDAAALRLSIEGSFNLMRTLIDTVDAAKAWPAGRRLALVDDGEDGLIHWGWVTDASAQWADLMVDGAGWIEAIVSIETAQAVQRQP